MQLTRPIGQYGLTLFSFIILAVNTIFFIQDRPEDKSWIYYTLTFVLCAVLSTLSLLKSPKREKEKPINWINGIGLLVLISLNLFIIFQNYSHHILWLDEYTHAIFANYNPAQAAASQQQPILGYLFSKSITQILGYSIFAVRILAIAPYLTAIILTGFWGLRLGGGIAFLILFANLTATNGVLNYVSLEGRSVALALMCLSILMHSWLEHQKYPHRWNAVFLMVAAYFFMISVGFQAWLVILTLIFIQIITWLKTSERKWLTSSLALLASFILYLPILVFLTLVAKNLSYTQVNPLERIFTIPENLIKEMFMFYVPNYQLILFVILFAALAISFFKTKSTVNQKRYWYLGLSFYLIFPLFFIWIFHSFINWYTNEWYRATFLFITLSIASIGISRMPGKSSILCSLAISIILWPTYLRSDLYKRVLSYRPNWEKLYSKIAQAESTDTRIYVAGTCNTDESWWCYNMFIGAEFYKSHINIDDIPSRQSNTHFDTTLNLNDNGMVYDFKNPFEGSKKIVVVIFSYNKDTSWLDTQTSLRYEKNGFEAEHFNEFITIKSTQPLDAKTGIKNILKWIVQNMPKDISNFYYFELLVRISVIEGDYKEANYWLNQMLAVPDFLEATKRHSRGNELITKLRQLIEKNDL